MQPTNDLDLLAIEHRSDKFGNHGYTPHYHDAFKAIREQPLELLEIGIGGYDDPKAGGSSLRMWRDYFPNGRITGLDYFDKSACAGDRIRVFRGSQADPCVIAEIIASSPTRSFDIVVDDGSHRSEHVIASFMMLFPYVAEGGWYVVEDTQTSYWSWCGGDVNKPFTTMAFFKSLVDGINWAEIPNPRYVPNLFDTSILSIQFLHNMIFIRKGQNTLPSNHLVGNDYPSA